MPKNEIESCEDMTTQMVGSYIKNVSWKAARTIFEVRSNMVKIDSNFGKLNSKSEYRVAMNT